MNYGGVLLVVGGRMRIRRGDAESGVRQGCRLNEMELRVEK